MSALLDTLAVSLWLFLAGFVRALRWDRCVAYFVRDPKIFTTTLSCMLLNGAVFWGSIKTLEWVVKPATTGMLTAALPPRAAAIALRAFDAAYAALWLVPAYAVSFFVSCGWYSEIAERAALAAQRLAQQRLADAAGIAAPVPPRILQVRRPDALTALSQELYRSILFAVVFLQATAAQRIPAAGPAASAALMAWLYGLYCFDYKWNLHGVPLEARTRAVEQQWAYFAGFGALVVAVPAVLPFFEGAALTGLLFPLFIVAAADADPKAAYDRARGWRRAAFPRMPIFGAAVAVTNAALAGLSLGAWQRNGRGRQKGEGGAANRGRSIMPNELPSDL